jgi:hypothetical protein
MEKENIIRKLIIDLINEYDDQGYILTEELVKKYEKQINELNKIEYIGRIPRKPRIE